jgi:nucleotide-binding universal stress UspA family protein
VTPSVVISYDGTPDDDDAVALGRIFLQAGASVSLAYVRHSHLQDEAAEARERTATDALLARGAQALGDGTRTQVLLNPSTASALRTLIVHEGGDILVFGSSYRTAAGHVAPGRAAEDLLDRGPAAVALAPAGLRDAEAHVATIALGASQPGDAAEQTASSLAARLDARLTKSPNRAADLLVLASRPDAPQGHVSLSAASELLAEAAACPVLVIANGSPLEFVAPRNAATPSTQAETAAMTP